MLCRYGAPQVKIRITRVPKHHAMKAFDHWHLRELAEAVTFHTCVWEVPGSNLCREIDCPDWSFRGFV
jgi:hypothetical protein